MNDYVSAPPLLEPEIKALLIDHFLRNKFISEQTTIVSEFTYDNHRGRADLVFVDEDKLTVCEVKSEHDSLYRLQGQVDNYLKYFDKVIISAASKHIPKILEVVPSTVSVLETSRASIKVVQRGRVERNKNKQNILKFLNKSSLKKLLFIPNSKQELSIGELIELATNLPLKKIRRFTFESIQRKYQQSSNDYLRTKGDIQKLSLYSQQRNKIKDRNTENYKSLENLMFKNDANLFQLAVLSSKNPFGEIPEEINKLINS